MSKGLKTLLICPECNADPEVACPRDVDATCAHCGASLCGRHIVAHLETVHCVSLEWRGFLKVPEEA